MIKVNFDKHEIKILKTEEGEIIRFAIPGSSVHYFKFIFEGPFMIVLGDHGNAIFRFSEVVNLNKVIEYNDFNYYIMSKLITSSVPRYHFDENKFQQDVQDFKERLDYDLSAEIHSALNFIIQCANESNTYENYCDLLKDGSNEYNLYCICDEHSYFNWGRISNPTFNVYWDALNEIHRSK